MLNQIEVEAVLIEALEEINEKWKLGANINSGYCPGAGGLIGSQVLVSVTCQIADILDIKIPDNVYLFLTRMSIDSSQLQKQLTS